MPFSVLHWLDLSGQELASAIGDANTDSNANFSESSYDGAIIELASKHYDTVIARIVDGTDHQSVYDAAQILHQTVHLKRLRKACRRHDKLIAKLAQLVRATDNINLTEKACEILSII
jgi:hypothetical protein